MKHAVSISLGSSTRDKTVEIELLGERVRIERRGCDGDERKAQRLFTELDGQVDAFGVGGVELYLRLEEREYPLRSGLNLVKNVHKTPAVDGRGLKHTMENRVMQMAAPRPAAAIRDRRAFMTLAVDRYGMAQSLASAGFEVVFGDLMFGVGLPIPVRGLPALRRLARVLMPIMGLLPISVLYPTGSSQEKITPKFESWYQWGSVVAGDFLYIKRHLPERLPGKIIVTNTTTAADVELLRQRGIAYLITSTPRIEGRSFGTNMMEAALTAVAGKGRVLTTAELEDMIAAAGWQPSVQKIN